MQAKLPGKLFSVIVVLITLIIVVASPEIVVAAAARGAQIPEGPCQVADDRWRSHHTEPSHIGADILRKNDLFADPLGHGRTIGRRRL